MKLDVITIHYNHEQTAQRPRSTTDAKCDFNSRIVDRGSDKFAIITKFIAEFDPIRRNIDEMIDD
jgi:hypothetical protein